jgi:hypothetical protein
MSQTAVRPDPPPQDLAPDARRRAEIAYAEQLLAWALHIGHDCGIEAAAKEVAGRDHGHKAAAVALDLPPHPLEGRAHVRILVRIAHALIAERMDGLAAVHVLGELHDQLANRFAAELDAAIEAPLEFDLDAWLVSTAEVDTDRIVETLAMLRAAAGVAPHLPREIRQEVVYLVLRVLRARVVLRVLRARASAAGPAPIVPLTHADAESFLNAIAGVEPPLPPGERAP